MPIYNLVSFLGMFALIFLAWLFSANRRVFNWRLVMWGLALQAGFAMVIFIFPPGVRFFMWLNGIVVTVMDSASAGAEFVFGRLALPPGTVNDAGEESLGFILAFQALPTIIFFSALMSMFYYWGVMQAVIRGFARVFTRLMGISGAESLCAASNIFVGIESSLTVKPHLEKMTRSELMTILTAGMATVASNVLAVYVFSLRSRFPTIAGHLISASFLSAPAALIMSKILLPETDAPKTLGRDVRIHYTRERSLFEAVINGSNVAVRLIVGIVALLIAVLGLVALADLFIGAAGARITALTGIALDWSLAGLMGYIFYPLTVLIGVPPDDAAVIAKIIGERIIVTEVTAYQHLASAIADGALIHGRSAVICAYALCGFAHIASMAIFIGGITAVAPKTTHTLSRIGFRALAAATLACLMTACVAGTFYREGSILFGG